MAALPSLRQLRYLVAIADTLNFTQAAEASFVTQSTLSGGIQELERVLGATLVERDRQHVALTPLGADVVARSRALLSMAGDLVEHVRAASEPMTGLVRLGAIPTIAPFLLPGLVRAVRARHPRLQIALREDQTDRLLERLRAGTLDFALVALPYDTGTLRVEPLFEEELWLIAREGDPSTRRARPPVDALDPGRLLLLEEGHCLRNHTLQGCGIAETANASGLEATSMATLVQMVEEGLGIALLPEMALRTGILNGTDVVARPISAPAPKRQIVLVARSSSARQAEFEALAAITREQAGKPPRRNRRAPAPYGQTATDGRTRR
jgi:LysR family transcriptional regulator, hydrogen peroxide-inducible genes activator